MCPYHTLLPLFPTSYLPALSLSPYISLSLALRGFLTPLLRCAAETGEEWELSFCMSSENQVYSGEVGWVGEAEREKTVGTRILSPHALTMRAEQQRTSRQAAHTWTHMHKLSRH